VRYAGVESETVSGLPPLGRVASWRVTAFCTRSKRRRAGPAGPGALLPLTSQGDFCRVADTLAMAPLFVDRVQEAVTRRLATLPGGGSALTVSLPTPAYRTE